MLRLSLGFHFLCFSLIVLKRGACRDWFVSPSKGLDDEYCGTETRPCRTYTHVIGAHRDFAVLSILLECGQANTYNECIPDRPNGQPGGVAITFPSQESSLHMSTWGNCSEDHAYIDCQKNGSAFWIQSQPGFASTVVFKNMVFANGSTAHQIVKPYHGSAITVHGYVNLTLENIIFYGNFNDSDISAANIKPSPVILIEHEAQTPSPVGFTMTIRGCLFQNNSNGVHVSSNSGVKAVVEGSTFFDNIGHYLSSSLYFTTKTLLELIIKQCQFESNLQLQNGSVVNIQVDNWSNIYILDTNFIKNKGVFLPDASNTTYMHDTLMGVVMTNINRSHVSVGYSNSSIRFERVNLANNYFPHRGGGFDIRCYYGGSSSAMDIIMDNVHIENNTGYWHGGGVTIMSSTNTFTLIRDSTFIGNKALGETSYGGALYISGSRTVIESCKFVNNSALTGTTLFLDKDHGECEIKNSILQSDLAQNATSIVHALSGSFLRLSNSTVHATRGHASTLAVMTREPLVLGYRPKHYIELLHGSKIVCPVKYSSFRNTTMPFAHLNVFHCHMCPGSTYTLHAAQISDHAAISRTDLECQECPGGGYCSNGDIHSRHNNWCYQENFDGMKRYACIACQPNRCCDKYICDNPKSCSGNREGTACSQCKEGYSLAFRLVDALTVTDQCFQNDSLRSSLGFLVVLICFPVSATLVYFVFQCYGCCCKNTPLCTKCKSCCKKRKSCCKKCKSCCQKWEPSLFATLQNIVFFFYPTFFAYEVNDGIFNVIPPIRLENITTSPPLIFTRHDSEAAFQLLCLLFILPLLSLVFIFVVLLCRGFCQNSTDNANARSLEGIQTKGLKIGSPNASSLEKNGTERTSAEYPNPGFQGDDETGKCSNEKGEPSSGQNNASDQGRDEAVEDKQTSCLNRVTADRCLYICVKHYFSVWHFFYGLITPTVVSMLVPTYAEKGLYREFTDGTIFPTNDPLIGVSFCLILFLGFYPFAVMYLLCFRCKDSKQKSCKPATCFYLWMLFGLPTLPLAVIILVMSCFKCGREKNCQCQQTSLMTRINEVFGEIAQEGRSKPNEDDQGKKKQKKKQNEPGHMNETGISQNADGQINERENVENEKDQKNRQKCIQNGDRHMNKGSKQNEEGQPNEQGSNQNTNVCQSMTSRVHDFLLSIWAGFELLYIFIFTTVSQCTSNNQAVRMPALISLSALHLSLVAWTRPLRHPFANVVYVLSSLTLVIVGALNAIQVGDFGTGHPLAISEGVLKAVDDVQFFLFIFPLLMCISLICWYICCKGRVCPKSGDTKRPRGQEFSKDSHKNTSDEPGANSAQQKIDVILEMPSTSDVE